MPHVMHKGAAQVAEDKPKDRFEHSSYCWCHRGTLLIFPEYSTHFLTSLPTVFIAAIRVFMDSIVRYVNSDTSIGRTETPMAGSRPGWLRGLAGLCAAQEHAQTKTSSTTIRQEVNFKSAPERIYEVLPLR